MRDKDLNDQLLSKQTETYKTEELNQEIHKVDYSSPELLEDIHKIEQDRINNYLKSQKQETTPKLTYEELEKRISAQKYDRGVFAKWKLGSSESMKAVTTGTKELGKLLSSKVGEVDYQTVKDAYNVLQEKCIDYLTTHNPKTAEGKARKEMVQKLLDRVLEEKRYIDVNSELVNEKDKQDGKTWGEMLAGSHTVVLSSGEYTVPKEAALAGTSEITRIKGKKEGEHYFFKTSEKLFIKPTGEAFATDVIGGYVFERVKLESGTDRDVSGMTKEQREERIDELERLITVSQLLKDYTKAIKPDENWKASFDSNWVYIKKALRDGSQPPISEEEAEGYKKYAAVYLNAIEKKVASHIEACKVARIRPGSEMSIRNVATTVLAEQLGISDLIAGSTEAVVEMGGKQIKGIRMEEAKGENALKTLETVELAEHRVMLSPQALSQFMTLQVFDILCGQVDRNINNFLIQKSVTKNEIVIERLKGIDNDMSFGTISYTDITAGVSFDRMKAIEKNGKILLQGLDAGFADKLLNIKPETIEFLLGPYLKPEEIKACQDRLKGIQQCLIRIKKLDEERKEGERPVLISDGKDWLRLRSEINVPVCPPDATDEQKKEYKVKEKNYIAKERDLSSNTIIPIEYRGYQAKEFYDVSMIRKLKEYEMKKKEKEKE